MLTEFTALENERNRIVSDLHDELGPLLSVVKLQVSTLAADKDEEKSELMYQANNNLETISSRMRGICNQLMPQSLTRHGLVSALRDFLTEIEKCSGISVEFSCSEDAAIPASAEIHLYRVIQEIVNNAIKHADADLIAVEIRQRRGKLIITVSDNGKGFNIEKIKKEKYGYGLNNILNRIGLLGGEVYVDSEIGRGTKYSLEIETKKKQSE